jgi:hypothetical protein
MFHGSGWPSSTLWNMDKMKRMQWRLARRPRHSRIVRQ